VNGLAEQAKAPPHQIASLFGSSDYEALRTIYEFNSAKMNHWSLSSQVHARDTLLLTIKSVAVLSSANTGIFNIQNSTFKGFQEGNPQAHQDGIAVHLFSDEGSFEIIFFQKEYRNAGGITQSKINRVIQSLHIQNAQPRSLRVGV
jgi:hypothetical protein